MPIQLKNGVFTCSIDTEMAWGYAHLEDDPTEYEHWASYGRVRDTIKRLLELMDKYEVRATWAFVGRLLVDPRDEAENSLYPANPQMASKYLTSGRLSEKAFVDRWYAPELLQMVRSARSGHEIGSHTFSHLIDGEEGYSKSRFEQDLKAATEQAERLGVELRSLIFPKNRVAHLEVVARHGFNAYRTVPQTRGANLPSLPRRIVQKFDAYLPMPPAVSHPRSEGGMWEIPATHYYRHTGGWARWQSNFVRTAKLKAGLRRAATRKALFHIWFHPYDVASEPERLFPPLERAFIEVNRLRDAGKLDNLTMGELSQLLSQAHPQTATVKSGSTAQ